MMFTFCPVDYGVFESLWVLCIEEFILEQSILFVGIVKEPSVKICPETIILKPTFKGR